MKILIINTCWKGSSTGKIAYGLHNMLLDNGHKSKFLYGMGKEKCTDSNVIKVAPSFEPKIHYRVNLFTGYHGRFAPIALYKTKKIIEQFKPDIVQLYNLHGYYMNIYKLMDYIKKRKIPTVYSMLDEYPYLGYCCYAYDCDQFKTGCKNCQLDLKERHLKSLFFNRAAQTTQLKKKSYENFDNLVFTGPQWVLERARESYLLKDKKMKQVDEYIDTDKVFVIKDSEKLKKKLGISQEQIVILDVAPYSDKRKGVEYFIDLAKTFKNTQYVFINVGYDGNMDGLPDNFIPISYVSNQDELATYYSMADLFVCTSFADTMPNVCLDALACGTPVCGFNISGVPYVADEPLGIFVEPGSVEGLASIVKKTNKKSEKLKQECREYAISRYSPQKYFNDMIEIYEELKNNPMK